MEDSLTPTSPEDSVNRLISLIKTLRGDNGCPWDKKQTPASISRYILEEAYELVDAIVGGDLSDIREEAGDVLFQILFVVELYHEAGRFSLADVIRSNLTKMIRRHPHVFGDATAETPEKVKENWQRIKRAEKGNDQPRSVLDGIPQGMPALLRAAAVSERAAGTGFDWDSIHGVMQKTMEEWQEFREEVGEMERTPNARRIADEFGDVLFTMVNVARFAGIDPELALVRAVQKFELRFRFMESEAAASGEKLKDLSFDAMHRLWDRAKNALD